MVPFGGTGRLRRELLLVLLSAGGVLASARGAVLCALATVLGWLTRPNLGALSLAVLVSVI
jgi:hypothetical protein